MQNTLRKRQRIGLLIRASSYAYQTEILTGAHQECQRCDLDLYCFAGGNLGAAADPLNAAYELASAEDLSGVILVPGTMGVAHDHPRVQALVEQFRTIPICTVGVRYPGVAAVCVDNASGVEQVTAHLASDHGRTRIAFLSGHGPEGEERLQGYKAGLTAAGLRVDPSLILRGDFSEDAGRGAVRQLMDGGRVRCDALVAANDWMALGALGELQQRGVKVPDDVSLVGFDDVEASSFVRPALTTIRQPARQLGMRAVAQIFRRLGGNTATEAVLLPTVLRVRQSCGCFGHVQTLQDQVRLSSMPPPQSLEASRKSWLAGVHDTAASFAEHMNPGWAEILARSLITELEAGNAGLFLKTLGDMLDHAASFGTLAVWHRVLSSLRDRCVLAITGSPLLLLQAESLFSQAHILIGDREEQAQGQRRVRREARLRQLEQMATDAHMAQTYEALQRVVARHCPLVQVPSCYVVEELAPDDARLLFAYSVKVSETAAQRSLGAFRAAEIVPARVLPSERHTMFVHSLTYAHKVVGFCALQLGPVDGALYIAIAKLIGAAIEQMRAREALVLETTQRVRMTQEVEILARIHSAILPHSASVQRLDFASAVLPAEGVGGDYFDVIPFDGGCWLGIGDVAGHGLQSGLVMLMTQSIVSALIRQSPGASPASAWRILNAVLRENIRERLKQDEHVTITLVRYTADGVLEFAGAHEDLIVLRKRTRTCELIRTHGIWAGIRDVPPDEVVPQTRCHLEPGDLLVLYTDGVIEAQNRDGELFGHERFCPILERFADEPVEFIKSQVLAALQQFMPEQVDDVALVVARYR